MTAQPSHRPATTTRSGTMQQQRAPTSAGARGRPEYHRSDGGGDMEHHHDGSVHPQHPAGRSTAPSFQQRRPQLHRNAHVNNNPHHNTQHQQHPRTGPAPAGGVRSAVGTPTYPTFRDQRGALWYSNDPYSDASNRKKPVSSASVPPAHRANHNSAAQPPAAAPAKVNYCRHYMLGQCNRGTMCRFAHLEQHHVVLRSSRREAQGLRARSASPLPSSAAVANAHSGEYDQAYDGYFNGLASVSPPPHLTTSPEHSFQEGSYDDVSAVFLSTADGHIEQCAPSWCVSLTAAPHALQRRGSSHHLPLTPSPEASRNASFTHNPYAAVRCHHPYAAAATFPSRAGEEDPTLYDDAMLYRAGTERGFDDYDAPLDASIDDVHTTLTTATTDSSVSNEVALRLPRNETQSYVDHMEDEAANHRDGGESANMAHHRAGTGLSSAPVSLHPSPSLSYSHPEDHHYDDVDMAAIALPATSSMSSCGRLHSSAPAAALLSSHPHFTAGARCSHGGYYGGTGAASLHHGSSSGRRPLTHSPAPQQHSPQLQWSDMLNSQAYASTASGEFASSSQTHSHNATPQLTPEEEQTLKSLW